MNKNFENCIIIFMIIGILYFYNVLITNPLRTANPLKLN